MAFHESGSPKHCPCRLRPGPGAPLHGRHSADFGFRFRAGRCRARREPVTGLTATKPTASSVAQVVSESGRVVVVGSQPLLEALRSEDGSRTLMLYGRPNAAYAIDYA